MNAQHAASRSVAPCHECSRRESCLGGALVSEDGLDNPGVQRLVIDRGDHLFREQDAAEALYVVRGGALKTYVVSAEGDEEVQGFQLSQDIAGLDALGTPTYRNSVRALSRTWLCRLPAAAVRERMMGSERMRDRLLAAMSHEFDRLHGMLHRERCSAEQRVAGFLVTQLDAQPNHDAEKAEITLPMSRSDLARYLDLATETVSRVFTRLQDRNVLRTSGAHCVITDRAALSNLA